MQVLLIEDHQRIAEFVREGLEEEGFSVHHEREGEAGLTAWIDLNPDVCVLDVMLPDIDGFEVLQRARGQGCATPVLLLSARAGVDDRVNGLKLGADDYLPKPFHFEELVARLRAIMRRGAASSNELVYADVRIDFEKHTAFRGGTPLRLTPREFSLLELFLRRPEVVLTRSVIGQRAFGLNFSTGTNVVDVYISYLRKKLAEHGPPLIHTERGVGYILQRRSAES
ncbi:MAG: response regulator transcription factor [Planctomycetota bacterium]